MDWSQLLAHVTETYVIGDSTDDQIELWWRFREGDTALSQRQTIRLTRTLGELWLVIAAEIGADIVAPLHHNSTLAIGAIAEDSNVLVLRAQIALTELSLERLDRALFLIAHEAARLKLAAPRRGIVTSALAHFAD